MTTREELKALVDQLPESSLEVVHTILRQRLQPPSPLTPELERRRLRGQEYRNLVEQRYRATLRSGTIGGMIGGGSWSTHEGTPYGRSSFQYWDGKALVHQSLHSFDSNEVEIMERFSKSDDGTKMLCIVELSSGGRTARHEEEFPTSSSLHRDNSPDSE